ncbi:2-succinyl-6-hydroxy-2,4-cyclohexadiene-1-carboxylate synthase [Listeria aquatica]|uniref:2-succinyl-6-hydroxy-2, 4-cyclohexadiene-1-carboxylate synthase n=1 Tax=Listeria aquatica TaxID=1494960 RepID=UPI0031F56392
MNLFYEVKRFGPGPVFLMLHGFTGTHQTFDEMLEYLSFGTVILPDLPGHGKSVSKDLADYSLKETEKALLAIFEAECPDEKPVVLGYSMGGRLALALVADYPDAFSGLVLISSSPGLSSEKERRLRREKDADWVDLLRASGINCFVQNWERLALFESQRELPVSCQKKIQTERLGQDAEGLAKSLIGVGTGALPSYWDQLGEIGLPVLLLAGEKDLKFTRLANEMLEKLPNRVYHEIVGAGHALQLEAPEETARVIQRFCKDYL